MSGVLLKGVQGLLWRRPQYVVYFMDLVQLVIAGEEREQGENFEEDTTDSPYIHLVAVVSVGHEALRRSIPSCGDVFC